MEAHRRALRDGPHRRRAGRDRRARRGGDGPRPGDPERVRALLPRQRIAPADVHPVATSAIRDAANGAAFLAEAEQRRAWRSRSSRPRMRPATATSPPSTPPRCATASCSSSAAAACSSSRSSDRRAGPERVVPARRGAHHRAVPVRRPPGQEEGARARARARAKALKTSTGWRTPARGWSAWAARCATSPPPCRAIDGGVDLGVQGFVIEPDALGELVGRLAALEPRAARIDPGIKPGRGDIILAAALVLEAVVERGGF